MGASALQVSFSHTLRPKRFYPVPTSDIRTFGTSVRQDDYFGRQVQEVIFPSLRDGDYAPFLKNHEDYKIMFELAVLEAISQEDVKKFLSELNITDKAMITKQAILDSVRRLEPSTKWNRTKFVVATTIKSFSFKLYLLFLIGSGLSISSNILGRSGRYIPGLQKINVQALISWLYTFGLLGFVRSSYKRQIGEYELYQLGKKIILKWMYRCTLIAPLQEGNKWYIKNVDDYLMGKFTGGGGLTVSDVKRLLDNESTFLPPHILNKMFDEIDNNRDKKWTLDDVKSYRDNQKNNMINHGSKFRTIMKNTLTSWDFWSNMTWFLGSIAYVICAYITEGKHMKQMFLKLGSILYFLGGALLLPNAYNDAVARVNYRQDIRKAIHVLELDGEHSNEPLDVISMFSVFLKSDILIPLEVFRNLYNSASKTRKSKPSVCEFVDFLLRGVAINQSRRRQKMTILHKFVTTKNFWIATLFSAAGFLFVFASYAAELRLSPLQTANIFISGSIAYAVGGIYNMLTVPVSLNTQHLVFDSKKMEFRDNFLQKVEGFSENTNLNTQEYYSENNYWKTKVLNYNENSYRKGFIDHSKMNHLKASY